MCVHAYNCYIYTPRPTRESIQDRMKISVGHDLYIAGRRRRRHARVRGGGNAKTYYYCRSLKIQQKRTNHCNFNVCRFRNPANAGLDGWIRRRIIVKRAGRAKCINFDDTRFEGKKIFYTNIYKIKKNYTSMMRKERIYLS